ncbi:MAG: DUF86 domain-containing protein [Flavobacteriaceae bacterium]
MIKNNSVYIKHILDQITHIENFMRGVSEEQFSTDIEKEYAIIRCFEIIGEASKKIDDNFKNKYPQIPWRKMAAFRDVLIHDYDRLVSEVIWKTVIDEIPTLKDSLVQIRNDES